MAFITNILKQAKAAEVKVEDPTRLSLQELEFLLGILKSTAIVGEQVEMFYTMVVKLQEQYIQLQQEATK